MSARRRASPYGNGRPIRWGTVSDGRVSNASLLPGPRRPPAASSPPGGAAASDRGPLTAHDVSPRDAATLQPSSSSSLASLAPHETRIGTPFGKVYSRSPGVCIRYCSRPRSAPGGHRRPRNASLLCLCPGRTSSTTEPVGFYRTAGATGEPSATNSCHGVRRRSSSTSSRLQIGQFRR